MLCSSKVMCDYTEPCQAAQQKNKFSGLERPYMADQKRPTTEGEGTIRHDAFRPGTLTPLSCEDHPQETSTDLLTCFRGIKRPRSTSASKRTTTQKHLRISSHTNVRETCVGLYGTHILYGPNTTASHSFGPGGSHTLWQQFCVSSAHFMPNPSCPHLPASQFLTQLSIAGCS